MKPKVTLEPALESRAALWTPRKRRAIAAKLERWAHELRVSAAILESDQALPSPPRPKALPPRRLLLN